MASSSSASKHLLRRLLIARTFPRTSSSSSLLRPLPVLEASVSPSIGSDGTFLNSRISRHLDPSRSRAFFCSRPSEVEEAQGPTAMDYQSMMPEDEFHSLADDTIHDLQEKFEEYGDSLQIDGYDVDYGNHVLTLKLGNFGTYVINKQTPNRQIWVSSPVSGPSRFDWDLTTKAWVYRRTKANLLQLLREELEQLCGQQIDLS
ncbi:frataxin, mitochondrial [Typha latifolia]|uniref:frataxin, mitochondrial n=1 Tax=Typha latifolia TaxID=4733 RepID=UPI003C2CC72C